MRTEADTTSAAATPTATKTHPTESHLVSRDGRRRSAFAYAAISFAVLVLLAGLGTGIFEAVTQLGKDQPIVVITDDTIGISPGLDRPDHSDGGERGNHRAKRQLGAPTADDRGRGRPYPGHGPDRPVGSVCRGSIEWPVQVHGWGRELEAPAYGMRAMCGRSASIPPPLQRSTPMRVTILSPPFFRSDDGGTTWKKLTTAPSPFVYSLPILWIDPTSSPSTIYTAAQSGGVWRSTDRGETWPGAGAAPTTAVDAHKQSLPPAVQQAVDVFRAPFEATGSNVTVTNSDTGFPIEAGMSPWTLRVDPNDPSIFYLGTDQGVYKSPDGGKTWRKSSVGLTSWAVSWMEPDPDSASILYAGVAEGIVRSDDGGETWRLILSGGDSLVIAPSGSPRLYATTPEGLFRSSDGGDAWDLVLPGGGSPLIAPSSPSTLYASTSEGLFRSGDGGGELDPARRGGRGCVVLL